MDDLMDLLKEITGCTTEELVAAAERELAKRKELGVNPQGN